MMKRTTIAGVLAIFMVALMVVSTLSVAADNEQDQSDARKKNTKRYMTNEYAFEKDTVYKFRFERGLMLGQWTLDEDPATDVAAEETGETDETNVESGTQDATDPDDDISGRIIGVYRLVKSSNGRAKGQFIGLYTQDGVEGYIHGRIVGHKFYGRFSSVDGDHYGKLGGHYRTDGTMNYFEGRWLDDATGATGQLKGRFTSRVKYVPKGVYNGLYYKDDVEAQDETDTEDGNDAEKTDAAPSADGRLKGTYGRLYISRNHSIGAFRGSWRPADGGRAGRMFGFHNGDVFVGFWKLPGGRLGGYLKGEIGNNSFEGSYQCLNGNSGSIKGRWTPATPRSTSWSIR